MKRPYQFKAQCLACNHKGIVLHDSKEDYQEVTVCPKCNGAFVDTWKLSKYKSAASKEIEIIMSNPNKPPTIKLDGQIIKSIIELRYHYDTDTEVPNGQHNFTVKYCDEETNAIRTVSVNKIWEGEVE